MEKDEKKGNSEVFDIAIVGSGVVGYGTAVYAGRFNMKTAVIGDTPGGVITTTDVVENYPGFIRLTGIELAEELKKHALDYKPEMITDKVTDVQKMENGLFELTTSEGKKVVSKTVVFATGTKWKKLGIPGEAEYANKGVHYCALCDGAFYKEKIVAVIGGSDSAAKDALVMTQWAKKVYIIYRGEKIRAEPVNYERVIANKKIEMIYNTNVKEIKGEKFVNRIVLDKPYDGSTDFKVDAIFVAIGHIALSELAVKLGVKTDEKGEIITDRDAKTNAPGIYAAGDVTNIRFKQAITGVADGVQAAYSAYEYINEKR